MSNYEGNSQSSELESIEALRRILEAEQGRPFTYEEALEIGQSLINFFETLADNADNNLPTTEEAETVEAAPQVLQQPQQMLLI